MIERILDWLVENYRKELSEIVPKVHPYPIDKWVYRVQLNEDQGWYKPENLEEKYPELRLPKGFNRMEPMHRELAVKNLPEYQPYSGVIKCVPIYEGRGGHMGPAVWTYVFYSQEDANAAIEGQTIHDPSGPHRKKKQQWPTVCRKLGWAIGAGGVIVMLPLALVVPWYLLWVILLLPALLGYRTYKRVYEWGDVDYKQYW